MTDGFDCRRFDALLPAAVADLVEAGDVAPFERHRRACPACAARFAEEHAAERRVAALIARAPAPPPPSGFADRVIDRLVSEPAAAEDRLWRNWPAPAAPRGFADRVIAALRRRPTRVPGRRVAVAAAILLGIGLLGLRQLRITGPDAPETTPVATEWLTVDELLARYGNGARLEHVVHAQFPDGIGAFDRTPLVADVSRRASGNAFHRALRESLREESGR